MLCVGSVFVCADVLCKSGDARADHIRDHGRVRPSISALLLETSAVDSMRSVDSGATRPAMCVCTLFTHTPLLPMQVLPLYFFHMVCAEYGFRTGVGWVVTALLYAGFL